MKSIDWNKPIRRINDQKPARFLGKYRDFFGDKELFCVVIPSGQKGGECTLGVHEDGSFGGDSCIENVPPPKLKIPFIVARNCNGVVFVTSDEIDWWKSPERTNVTILSEGVMEVEDK